MDNVLYRNSESYYENVKAEINNYAAEMKLSNLNLIDDGKYSCVMKGVSENMGITGIHNL